MELGMSTTTWNPTYNLSAMSKEEILQNHNSINMLSFGIYLSEEDIDLPKLYWITNYTRTITSRHTLRAQLSARPNQFLRF